MGYQDNVRLNTIIELRVISYGRTLNDIEISATSFQIRYLMLIKSVRGHYAKYIMFNQMFNLLYFKMNHQNI